MPPVPALTLADQTVAQYSNGVRLTAFVDTVLAGQTVRVIINRDLAHAFTTTVQADGSISVPYDVTLPGAPTGCGWNSPGWMAAWSARPSAPSPA